VLNEVRGLGGAGIDLALFSFKHPADEVAQQRGVSEWIARTTYIPRGASAACFAAALSCFLRSPAGFLRALAAARRLGGRMSHLRHLPEIFFLADRIHRAGARHVHAQHADYLADAALAAASCLGLSFSFTGHANDLYTNPGRLIDKIGKATFVSTCTGFNEGYLKDLCSRAGAAPGVDPAKIQRVYHGVDLARFSPPVAGSAPAPPSRLITVTRLKKKKGFEYLLSALARIREQGAEFELDIYGEGDERPAIEKGIEDRGLGDRVKLRGAISHERIPQALSGSGIFVLPCVVLPNQDRDGIPNTLIEALASGVPVVSTAISGIPEAVRDGESGLLVAERDPEALAAALVRLMTDADLRARCAREGRRVAESMFSIEATGRSLARLFRSSVGS
jgi:glycosyltransferase involved in cell wall biosynthesis